MRITDNSELGISERILSQCLLEKKHLGNFSTSFHHKRLHLEVLPNKSQLNSMPSLNSNICQLVINTNISVAQIAKLLDFSCVESIDRYFRMKRNKPADIS